MRQRRGRGFRSQTMPDSLRHLKAQLTHMEYVAEVIAGDIFVLETALKAMPSYQDKRVAASTIDAMHAFRDQVAIRIEELERQIATHQKGK